MEDVSRTLISGRRKLFPNKLRQEKVQLQVKHEVAKKVTQVKENMDDDALLKVATVAKISWLNCCHGLAILMQH